MCKTEILQTALELTAKQGCLVSLHTVANESGIELLTLRTWFPNTETLLGAVVRRELELAACEWLTNKRRHKPMNREMALKSLLLLMLQRCSAPPRLTLWQVVLAEEEGELRRTCRRLVNAYTTVHVKPLFQQALAAGDIKNETWPGCMLLYLAMIQRNIDMLADNTYPLTELEQIVETTWSTYWRGLA